MAFVLLRAASGHRGLGGRVPNPRIYPEYRHHACPVRDDVQCLGRSIDAAGIWISVLETATPAQGTLDRSWHTRHRPRGPVCLSRSRGHPWKDSHHRRRSIRKWRADVRHRHEIGCNRAKNAEDRPAASPPENRRSHYDIAVFDGLPGLRPGEADFRLNDCVFACRAVTTAEFVALETLSGEGGRRRRMG